MREDDLRTIDHRVKVWLLVVSVATIAILVAAALQENLFPDWRRLRQQYTRILEAKATDAPGKAAARQFEVRIVQNYIPALGAVDRCMTCHAGVQDPRMADQPQPFTTHPGRHLQIHDPEKFGCTVCHEGQGRATEIADAHGRTPHWEHPLLEAQFTGATCTKCHSEADLYGAPALLVRADGRGDGSPTSQLLREGRRLVQEEGCLGCHVIDGKGGPLGPDLTYVGNKTRHQFDFSHVDRHEPREVTYWLKKHFLEPGALSPGTFMPPTRHGEEGADALTAYVLSLRREEAGSYVYQERPGTASADAEPGKDLYTRYCSACHGQDGHESRVRGIRTPALNNPDALAVAGDDYYRFIIANGRSAAGHTYMPAWGEGHGNLSRREIDSIVEHIRSWQPPGPRLSEVSPRAGDPRAGRAYYDGLCAGCHGLKGEGGIGNSLRSPTFLAVADDRFLAESIINGRPGTAMPSWKHLSRRAVSDILAYIRTWQHEPPSFADVRASMRTVSAADNARIGRYLYKGNCEACHGARGEGRIGVSLTSPDFLRAVDDAYLYRAITEGRPTTAMPAWRGLPADDVGALIAYLRSFQRGQPLRLQRQVPPGDYAVGEVYYRVSCSGCHGDHASGGVGPQLANRVFLDSVSDAVLFHWIAHGRAGSAMKGFLSYEQGPTQLSAGQIADIIAYIRHVGTGDGPPTLRTGVGNPRIGAQLFEGNCASCHGRDGEGASGPQLNNPSFLQTASDGFLAATIVLGRADTPMPQMVRGKEGMGQLSPDSVQDIIAYMRLWAYPQTWRKTRRVTEMSSRAIASGRDHYSRYCAGCHGPNGLGERDGPGYYAPALNNREFLEAASDGFLLATIARGRGGTPMRPFGKGSGGIVPARPEVISDIVSFIRSWQQQTTTSAGGTNHEKR
jgi:mono/diheme cytochrome c family protein